MTYTSTSLWLPFRFSYFLHSVSPAIIQTDDDYSRLFTELAIIFLVFAIKKCPLDIMMLPLETIRLKPYSKFLHRSIFCCVHPSLDDRNTRRKVLAIFIFGPCKFLAIFLFYFNVKVFLRNFNRSFRESYYYYYPLIYFNSKKYQEKVFTCLLDRPPSRESVGGASYALSLQRK